MKVAPRSMLMAVLCLGFVTMAKGQTEFGNPWYFGGSYSAPAQETTTPWFTFTAPEDTVVSGAQFIATGIIEGTEVVVSIKAVDDSGRPTGPALGSNTFQPEIVGDWNALTLPDISLTAGTVYAVELTTSTPGGYYGWRANAGPTGGSQPYGTVDPHFRSGWQSNPPENESYIWLLETDMGRAIGQPYVYVSEVSVAQESIAWGQRFVFDASQAGGNQFLTSVTLPFVIGDVAPSAPITLNILNDAGIVLGSAELDISGASQGDIEALFELPNEVYLADGEAYYINVFSTESAFNSVKWGQYVTSNDLLFNGATFQGMDGYAVVWGTQWNFTEPPDVYLDRDFSFNLTMIAVPEPGVAALLAVGGISGFLTLRRRRK